MQLFTTKDRYKSELVCPVTKETLSRKDIFHNKGTCVSCGHQEISSTVSHYTHQRYILRLYKFLGITYKTKVNFLT